MLGGRVVVGVDNGVCATLSARYSRSSLADGGQCPAGKGSTAGGICDMLNEKVGQKKQCSDVDRSREFDRYAVMTRLLG